MNPMYQISILCPIFVFSIRCPFLLGVCNSRAFVIVVVTVSFSFYFSLVLCVCVSCVSFFTSFLCLLLPFLMMSPRIIRLNKCWQEPAVIFYMKNSEKYKNDSIWLPRYEPETFSSHSKCRHMKHDLDDSLV